MRRQHIVDFAALFHRKDSRKESFEHSFSLDACFSGVNYCVRRRVSSFPRSLGAAGRNRYIGNLSARVLLPGWRPRPVYCAGKRRILRVCQSASCANDPLPGGRKIAQPDESSANTAGSSRSPVIHQNRVCRDALKALNRQERCVHSVSRSSRLGIPPFTSSRARMRAASFQLRPAAGGGLGNPIACRIPA
jgi:hypothetical protein